MKRPWWDHAKHSDGIAYESAAEAFMDEQAKTIEALRGNLSPRRNQMKYRKKPVVIDAFQMTKNRRSDNSEWPTWLNTAWQKPVAEVGSVFCSADGGIVGERDTPLFINTLKGAVRVFWDDWIIRGVEGELYLFKPDVIEANPWHESGDHPEVGYYRRPDDPGTRECEECGRIMHDHGWIDTPGSGLTVCPDDWIIESAQGEISVRKPNIFAATHEEWFVQRDEPELSRAELSLAIGLVEDKTAEQAKTIERLQSLLRELRVHLREGSIERLRIDATLKEGE